MNYTAACDYKNTSMQEFSILILAASCTSSIETRLLVERLAGKDSELVVQVISVGILRSLGAQRRYMTLECPN
jgi:hypothetical protein